MSLHLHRARQLTAWTLGAIAMAPFALCFAAPERVSRNAPATGRLIYAGRPLDETIMCLDRNGEHMAFTLLEGEGEFRIVSMACAGDGAVPGRYRAHLYGMHPMAPKFPSRYRDAKTSGIDLDIAPGWNDFRIELQPAPDDPHR
jgi:hypothetical protein